MVKCILKNCTSSYDKNIELSFHSFPLNDRYKEWLQAIPENLIELPLQQCTHICSKHFSKDAYYPKCTPTSNVRLWKNAIPSIFYISNKDETTEENTVEKKRKSIDICTQVSPKRIRMQQNIMEKVKAW
ncbi:THAP domain-containing protein 1-like isoform X2 [Polyergus mexicanus]|uniref:THAP domain-containing protein 1-like isoform X2 n=1 Tax=Polyergus mexicanus TaxID=615972 RepID=UPI0038B59111